MDHAIPHQHDIIRSGTLVVNGDCDDTYVYRIYDVARRVEGRTIKALRPSHNIAFNVS